MSMFNTGDILETIEMFTQDNLDVRTVTMAYHKDRFIIFLGFRVLKYLFYFP